MRMLACTVTAERKVHSGRSWRSSHRSQILACSPVTVLLLRKQTRALYRYMNIRNVSIAGVTPVLVRGILC